LWAAAPAAEEPDGAAAPATSTPEAVAPQPARRGQVAPTVFERGPGVLGVSIQTLRKEALEAYATPALGLVVMGLQDLKLSPKNRDGLVALDLNEQLQFAFNSHGVPKESRRLLDGIARLLVENPDTALILLCHTDDQGDAGYNLRLSQRRAEALKAYLVGRGVADSRITAAGRGEEEPLVDPGGRTPTRAEREQNRRTELLITPLETTPASEGQPTRIANSEDARGAAN
jgi:outer membrane protein OmpA-like peptidoglycan-associated protein